MSSIANGRETVYFNINAATSYVAAFLCAFIRVLHRRHVSRSHIPHYSCAAYLPEKDQRLVFPPESASFDIHQRIDRVYPSLLTEPKLLVADIKKSQSIVLDEGKHYPHHNFYFVKGRSVEDLKVLGAILMSDFVEDQMEMLSPKMHGGFYRWQAQNLRKLRVPNVMKLSKRVRRRLLSVFDTADSALINSICSSFLSNLHD